MAVGRDHKLSKGGKPVPGRVGHDRIQQAGGRQSIGESIRYWYSLKGGGDFERIELDAVIHPDGHFILVPTAVKMRNRKRARVLERVGEPLSLHQDYQSKLWKQQIIAIRAQSPSHIKWAASQIRRVVEEHRDANITHILEPDLMRTAGALSLLGAQLDPYLGKGYDCTDSRFQFAKLPVYRCPVEIKKRSSGFKYQMSRYPTLPRAVVLCMEHDIVNAPAHIDFIELPTLEECLRG